MSNDPRITQAIATFTKPYKLYPNSQNLFGIEVDNYDIRTFEPLDYCAINELEFGNIVVERTLGAEQLVVFKVLDNDAETYCRSAIKAGEINTIYQVEVTLPFVTGGIM